MAYMRPRTHISTDRILAALDAHQGNVEAAAVELGVSSRTLYRRMAEYGIKPRVRYEAAEAA